MITWVDCVVIQEGNQDLRHKAEKERFIRQMTADSREGNQATHTQNLQILSDGALLWQLQKIIDLAG